MKNIELTKGKITIVDDFVFADISKYNWYYSHGYAMRDTKKNGKRKRIYLHRYISKATIGQIVDHIDGNKLNNIISNLRICTNKDNVRSQRKSKKRKNTSKFKGVYKCTKRKMFVAQITVNRKLINLGRFKNEDDAAIAYNNAAEEHFGEFCVKNVLGK